MRIMCLDDLPRKGKFINWTLSINKDIEFIYDNIKGKIKIVKYNKKTSMLTVEYKSEFFDIHTGNFSNCKITKILGERTPNFKIEIGQILKDEKRDITIIDRFKKNNVKWYKYKCNKCGFECGEHYDLKKNKYKEEHWIREPDLLKYKGCSCCCNPSQIVVQGINDIPTTAPWMVKYFQGGYDEAKIYTCSSHKKVHSICPDCGREKDKPIAISSIYKNNSISCMCSDGFKYPSKFMMSILKQLNIDYISEFNPSWIKPKRYDFYIPSMNLIIEMDGALGHGNKVHYKSKITIKESKEQDNYKDKMANDNGIEVIRIDCAYKNIENRFEFIKSNIINSKLNNIFDFINVDWVKCHEFAFYSNIKKDICNIYKYNPDISLISIGNIANISTGTVRTYLKEGTKLGWCDYDSNLAKKNNYNNQKTRNKYKRKPIICVETGQIFESITECVNKSEEIFGVKMSNSCISRVCEGKSTKHRGLSFNFYKNTREQGDIDG